MFYHWLIIVLMRYYWVEKKSKIKVFIIDTNRFTFDKSYKSVFFFCCCRKATGKKKFFVEKQLEKKKFKQLTRFDRFGKAKLASLLFRFLPETHLLFDLKLKNKAPLRAKTFEKFALSNPSNSL